MKRAVAPGTSFIILLMIILQLTRPVHAQQTPRLTCQDTINMITEAYTAGQWQATRYYAREFIRHSHIKEANFFLSSRYRIFNYKDCDGELGKVYYYLIKSATRMYEPDTALRAYEEMLKRGLDLGDDSLKKELGQHYNIKRSVISVFAGASNPYGKFNYRLGFQLGLGIIPLFFEMSFRNKYFEHQSDEVTGGFGKPLKTYPNTYPKYQFNFSGHERIIETVYNSRVPLRLSNYMPRVLFPYYSLGLSVSYYVNSKADQYRVSIIKSLTDTVTYSSGPGRSLENISELNMDLKRMYSNRFSYGFYNGLGVSLILSKDLVLFGEVRYYIGTIYKYRYNEFNTFKPGVNNFTFMIGLSKGNTKVTRK